MDIPFAFRRRAGDGAVFTSRKCPNGPDLTCELPFGFVWTPMSPSPDTNTTNTCVPGNITTNLPPVLCLKCLCYMNLYSEYDAKAGLWSCPFCGYNKNVIPPTNLFGEEPSSMMSLSSPPMVSPIVEYRQKIGRGNNNNDYSSSSSVVVVVLDANLPSSEARAVAKSLQELLLSEEKRKSNSSTINLSLLMFDDCVSIYQLGITGIVSADIVQPIVDEDGIYINNEEEEDLEEAFRRARASSRSYFSKVSSVADFAAFNLCIDGVFGLPINQSNGNNTSRKSATTPSPLPPSPLSRKDLLKRRKEERLKRQKEESNGGGGVIEKEISSSPWVDVNNGSVSGGALPRRPSRCTGEAIQCALEVAASIHSSSSSSRRILLFTNGCPNLGCGNIVRRQSNNTSKNRQHAGVDVIDNLAMVETAKYFEALGKEAVVENDIGVDVFLSGVGSLGLQVYQALVDAGGGYALPYESFCSTISSASSYSEKFKSDLQYTMMHTYIPARSNTNSNNSANTNERTLGESAPHINITMNNSIDGCIADVRMSDFITPSHVVGAMEVLGNKELLTTTNSVTSSSSSNHYCLSNERASFLDGQTLAARRGITTNHLPSEKFVRETLTRVRMGRYDPLSTLSFMLRIYDTNTSFSDNNNNKFAYFQCIIRYSEEDGNVLVTRVNTHRLPIAKNVYDFLDSMDEQVVPVVLGKEAVFRSIIGRDNDGNDEAIDALVVDNTPARFEFLAHEAQKDLDNTIHRVSGAYRLTSLEAGTMSHRDFVEEGSTSLAHSSLGFAFPPELEDALHRLYHLRRGSMLSPGPVGSMEERAQLRNLFLRLPLDDCLCMMAPSLWSYDISSGGGTPSTMSLQEIPSDTMTLWDNRIIAADHHDCVFVWSGKAVTHDTYDKIRDRCKEFLLERSGTRFPQPSLHILTEGHSMSRRFTSRLAPSHADPEEQQKAHYPDLDMLSEDEMRALRDKFRFYEENADASFRKWFWTVAGASSNARYEGMSLCE